MKTKPDPNSLLGHLIELRNRILRSVIAVLLVFLCLAYFARDIYALLAKPLLAVLPEGTSMIATDVAAPFFAPFKLTFMVSICLAIPYILLQVWQFIAPALY
ncbi:twin-arginine translocase subunit TatC, partial [Alishewanella sp. SMS9]|nr:twin-arginine translocase subunit TatC [Alishewanella sp. SMS9]